MLLGQKSKTIKRLEILKESGSGPSGRDGDAASPRNASIKADNKAYTETFNLCSIVEKTPISLYYIILLVGWEKNLSPITQYLC